MKIDKQNGNIAFCDSEHKYWDVNDPTKKYTSVTTLIHSYSQPFDSDFWSSYKALETLIPKENWAIEKKSLLNLKKIKPEILEAYGISDLEFNKAKQDILDDWQKKNVESCERGTKIHADIENSFYKKKTNIDVSKFGVGGKFICKKDYYDLDLENGVYPEYLIYRESPDGKLLLAGQVDLIIKQGNDIYIADHKSNRKIDMKGGFDVNTRSTAKMQYPLNHLEDANYYHYTLQLSTYAWMLQKINPNFVIKDLILNHYDHDGNNTIYHCDYLKDDVERMLYDYKKKLIIEESRNKRKRIEY